jgi:ADP-ribose pyrophosphatase YjhB (NUDIX family)
MSQRRVNVRGIIFKDNQLLVAKMKQRDGSESEYWATFGGGLDFGESLHVGLHREMIEETGIPPEIGKLLFVQQFNDGDKEQLEFFFQITNTEDYATIDLKTTSHGALEMVRAQFVDPKQEIVLPAFLQTIDIGAAIKTDQPVYIYNELK